MYTNGAKALAAAKAADHVANCLRAYAAGMGGSQCHREQLIEVLLASEALDYQLEFDDLLTLRKWDQRIAA